MINKDVLTNAEEKPENIGPNERYRFTLDICEKGISLTFFNADGTPSQGSEAQRAFAILRNIIKATEENFQDEGSDSQNGNPSGLIN